MAGPRTWKMPLAWNGKRDQDAGWQRRGQPRYSLEKNNGGRRQGSQAVGWESCVLETLRGRRVFQLGTTGRWWLHTLCDFIHFLYGPSQVPIKMFPGFYTSPVFTPTLGSPPKDVNSGFYCTHLIIMLIVLFLPHISHMFSWSPCKI